MTPTSDDAAHRAFRATGEYRDALWRYVTVKILDGTRVTAHDFQQGDKYKEAFEAWSRDASAATSGYQSTNEYWGWRYGYGDGTAERLQQVAEYEPRALAAWRDARAEPAGVAGADDLFPIGTRLVTRSEASLRMARVAGHAVLSGGERAYVLEYGSGTPTCGVQPVKFVHETYERVDAAG